MIKNTNDHDKEHFTKKLKCKQHISLQTFIVKITIVIIYISQAITSVCALPTPPPILILPIPTAHQLSWQLSEMTLLLHFQPHTFTGHDDPSGFNPTSFNATQWVTVAKGNGFSRIVLTVKHQDGFCLWPSEYIDYSVKSTPWRNGSGDVVGELADAARKAGLQLGFHLSRWYDDKPKYEQPLKYNQYYMGQITELLTRYGVVKEVFLDSAKDNKTRTEFLFDEWLSLIHQLQPEAVISSSFGPDARWTGNEDGVAASTCWSLFKRRDFAEARSLIPGGDPSGPDRVPPVCVASIRFGGPLQASQAPKSAMALLDLLQICWQRLPVGTKLPLTPSGLISGEDTQVLRTFYAIRSSIFSHNLAKQALLAVSSTRGCFGNPQFAAHRVLDERIHTYWSPDKKQLEWIMYLIFPEPETFNVLKVQEPIQMGQRIIRFHLDMYNENGESLKVISSTTVGYQRLLRSPTVKTRRIKLVIDKSRAEPLISYLGIYMDPVSSSYSSEGQVLQQKTDSLPQIATI